MNRPDDCPRCPNPLKRKLYFECGHNPQEAVFEIDDGVVEPNQQFVLDRINIDTSNLTRPIVKFDFTSIVTFEAEDEEGLEHEVEVDLLFRLIRSCNGSSEVVQTWRYLFKIDIEPNIAEFETEISESFAFSFCDHPCPHCCEYSVVVEGRDFEGEFEFLRVTRPVLTALIQGYSEN